MQHSPIVSVQHKYGFTILELSIVLMVIGLLTGGILAGQSLIRASQLRAIPAEKERFVTAMNVFQEKYRAMPGDMPNAYQFWGAACGTNTTDASTGCNGNGNGYVSTAPLGENIKVWEHLARAQLIQGNFDGTGTDVTPTNSPTSKISAGVWDFDDMSPVMATPYTDMAGYDPVKTMRQVLHFGSTGSAPNLAEHPTLTRLEAWSIDTKIDDGRANTGTMRGNAMLECRDVGTDYYEVNGTNDGDRETTDCVLHFITKAN